MFWLMHIDITVEQHCFMISCVTGHARSHKHVCLVLQKLNSYASYENCNFFEDIIMSLRLFSFCIDLLSFHSNIIQLQDYISEYLYYCWKIDMILKRTFGFTAGKISANQCFPRIHILVTPQWPQLLWTKTAAELHGFVDGHLTGVSSQSLQPLLLHPFSGSVLIPDPLSTCIYLSLVYSVLCSLIWP